MPFFMRRRLGGTLVLIASACTAACFGGQTGDSDGALAPPPGWSAAECTTSPITLDLDQVLPVGHSARDALDPLLGELEVPAFRIPKRFVDSYFEPTALLPTPDEVTSQAQLSVRVEYTGAQRAAVYSGHCPWEDNDLVLPVKVTVQSADGSLERVVVGKLAGLPGPMHFYPDELAYNSSCVLGEWLQVARDGTWYGQLCDDDELVRFPVPCEGFAQTTELDEQRVDELPAPNESVEQINAQAFELVGFADAPIPAQLELKTRDGWACYDDSGLGLLWSLPVTVTLRSEQLELEVPGMLMAMLQDETASSSERFDITLSARGELDPESRHMVEARSNFRVTKAELSIELSYDEAPTAGRIYFSGSAAGTVTSDPNESWTIEAVP